MKRGSVMRKKRFLAIVAAIALSISFTAPVTVSATEVEEEIPDDEQEDGEQTTIIAPDADSEDSAGGDGSSSGSQSSGSSGSSGSTGSTKSSDSSLSHLGISPGSLSPAFSAGTHEYTATVDAGVTAISVAAKPNNSKAVIASVSGAKSLSPGTNTVKVVVEAENGATTTYTITVNCGGSTAAAQPTQDSTAGDDDTSAGAEAIEGEISAIDDAEETQKEEPAVTFDDNGYLIYEGNAYIPSSMMPEGEYVSLDKYNRLYEQAQAQKSKNMRILIILAVLLVLSLIVILNLALKLRDVCQDAKLGLNDPVDDEPKRQKAKPEKPQREKKEKAPQPTDVKMTQPKNMRVTQPKNVQATQPKNVQATQLKPEKPSKVSKSAKKTEDLEILDLNDL